MVCEGVHGCLNQAEGRAQPLLLFQLQLFHVPRGHGFSGDESIHMTELDSVSLAVYQNVWVISMEGRHSAVRRTSGLMLGLLSSRELDGQRLQLVLAIS